MSLFYDSDNFDISSTEEINSLLAELPFELIKESILEQINDPISTKTNYVDIIIDKCEMFKSQYEGDDDLRQQIDESLRDFFVFIIKNIDDKFNLGIDINEIASYNNFVTVGTAIYKYFILRYSKNVTRFIIKYIFKHKKRLSEYYQDKTKRDVSTLAYKKQIKNIDDLTIITNLPTIIKYIISLDITSEEFVSLSASDDNFNASVVMNLITSNLLIGDFFESYIKLCVNSHEYIIDELQTDIRIKLLNKII